MPQGPYRVHWVLPGPPDPPYSAHPGPPPAGAGVGGGQKIRSRTLTKGGAKTRYYLKFLNSAFLVS